MTNMPAISLAAVRGRRLLTLELATEIERRGFQAIFGPSLGDVMSLSLSIAHVTEKIVFGTSIVPIYLRHPSDLAAAAAYVHEVSAGRFRLGIGVSHGPAHARLGVTVGKPLADMRAYVTAMKESARQVGDLPPLILATLRDRMLALALEIAEGGVWANAARSHMAAQLGRVDIPDGFFVGNMIPTVVADDRDAARAVLRKVLSTYVMLPNYRNYWKQAGYVEEMDALEGVAPTDAPARMSDRWLDDCTLSGSPGEVRDGVDAWVAAGVKTPILVPSSVNGGQVKAIEELLGAFAS